MRRAPGGALRLLPPLAAATLLVSAAAGSTGRPDSTGTAARGFAVEIVVPGQDAVVAVPVEAPRDATADGQSFAYPTDGSIVSTGGIRASAQAVAGATASSSASADVNQLSLLGGDVSATLVSARAEASAGPLSANGDVRASTITDLVVLGQPVTTLTPNLRIPLADWGSLTVLEQSAAPGAATGEPSFRGTVSALDVRLTAAHGGLPAQSEIIVGYSEAFAQSVPARLEPPAATSTKRVGSVAPAQPAKQPVRTPKTRPAGRPGTPAHGPQRGAHPKLTAGPYVFPVYGQVVFADTFGAPGAPVGYDHGDDLFAPLGTPVLAAADGRVYSVGWDGVGGNRLWLRDGQGNRFYYAHLAAFTPSAGNGRIVRAGTVLGFVGNTGDAVATPFHLHFEVHPVSLLYLGPDGAVDPTRYLAALAAPAQRELHRGAGLGTARPHLEPGSEAGRDPARRLRHLGRGRSRPGIAPARARRPRFHGGRRRPRACG